MNVAKNIIKGFINTNGREGQEIEKGRKHKSTIFDEQKLIFGNQISLAFKCHSQVQS